jgi:hypothetical protein
MIFVTAPDDNAECRFTVSCEPQALLCQVKARTAHTIKEIEMSVEGVEEEQMAPFSARWASDGAQMLVPVDRESPVELFLFLKGTDTSQGHPPSARMPSDESETLELTRESWRWHVLSLAPNAETRGRGWITFTTDEPWNPKLSNYPCDLAVQVGRVVAFPPRACPDVNK